MKPVIFLALVLGLVGCAASDGAGAGAGGGGADASDNPAPRPDSAPPPPTIDAAWPQFFDASEPDAAPPVAIDASPPDAMPVCAAPGEGTCSSPKLLDAECTGVVVGNTCGAGDDVTVSCAPGGTEDVVFRLCGSWQPFELTAGFVTQLVTAPAGQCGGSVLACGVDFGLDSSCDSSFFLVVEKLDGGCGPFELTVAQ